MAIAVGQAQGSLAKAVIALSQPNAVFGGKPHQDFAATMVETRVRGQGDPPRLHRGVDRHTGQARGLHRTPRQCRSDGRGEQLFHPVHTDALAPAGQ
jgi:hypothetical protein